jgi:hypothetical protein
MKPRVAKLDSMNFASKNLEAYFSNDDYIIETVKSVGVFEPTRWVKVFKSKLTRNIVEAKILHTSTGLTIPLKRYSRSSQTQVIEFAGLHGYNERSKLLSELLQGLKEQIQHEQVTRLDVAIDFKGNIPNKVIKKLCKDREPFKFMNTIYYKSNSEKKQNYYMNIKTYNKSLTKNDTQNIHRLEFVFMRDYLKKIQVKDIEKSFKRMEKSIKKFSGLEVQISFL